MSRGGGGPMNESTTVINLSASTESTASTTTSTASGGSTIALQHDSVEKSEKPLDDNVQNNETTSFLPKW